MISAPPTAHTRKLIVSSTARYSAKNLLSYRAKSISAVFTFPLFFEKRVISWSSCPKALTTRAPVKFSFICPLRRRLARCLFP